MIDVFEVLPSLHLTLSGSSMRPFALQAARFDCRRPRRLENLLHRIVVFRQEDRQVAHRAVRSWVDANGEHWLYTRGDSSTGSEKVRRANVIAVVDALLVGRVRVPLHGIPARLEGAIAWTGRQVVVSPRRIQRLRQRLAA